MNTILKNTISITAITLVAGLALGVVQDITAGPIADQALKAKEEAYKAVFEDASGFSEYSLDDDRANFTFYCKDQGVGMSEDFIAHAFDMFSQESKTSRSRYDGTYTSDVTLTLPSVEEAPVYDVVFVLDKSSCKEEAIASADEMLTALQNQVTNNNAKIQMFFAGKNHFRACLAIKFHYRQSTCRKLSKQRSFLGTVQFF